MPAAPTPSGSASDGQPLTTPADTAPHGYRAPDAAATARRRRRPADEMSVPAHTTPGPCADIACPVQGTGTPQGIVWVPRLTSPDLSALRAPLWPRREYGRPACAGARTPCGPPSTYTRHPPAAGRRAL